MPDPVHLPTPAKVVLVKPGGVRVPVSFDAGDVVATTADEREALDQLQQILARRGDALPDTVADVKAWVGDDPARAARALTAEQARPGGPRKSLEPWLAGLAAPDDDTATDADDSTREGDDT